MAAYFLLEQDGVILFKIFNVHNDISKDQDPKYSQKETKSIEK